MLELHPLKGYVFMCACLSVFYAGVPLEPTLRL